ncbi:MAG: MBL fold metallo-hydrolase [Armatimonadetes bacterium]|nr:MBL fold metallo-hydrolase [Armatimonadota bacterium]
MAVQYERIVVGPLETNCYVVWDTDSLCAVIIDPGGDSDSIRRCIGSNNLNVQLILLTHGHPDHCFAAGELAAEYGVEVAMHKADIDQIECGMELAEMFYDISAFVPFNPAHLLENGDILNYENLKIEVIHTPGHSPGGLCFAVDAGIFCGDTIFANSIGRTDFPGGSHTQLIASIHNALMSKPDNTPLFPGHGPSTTVGRERATNPFLS